MSSVSEEEEKEDGLKKLFKEIMSKNFSIFDELHRFNLDSTKFLYPREDKFKEMHTKIHYSQTSKNYRQKKNSDRGYTLPIREKQFKWHQISIKQPGASSS